MSNGTGIEWTEATWNPIAGCSIISPGCTNCYAMKMAARIEVMGTAPHYAGLTQPSKGGAVWTGKIAVAPDHILTQPLRWKRGRMIFVNSMSDLFHEAVPEAVIDQVFAVMALCPQHTFQVLTKRPERMRNYVRGPWQFRLIPWLTALDPKHIEGQGALLRTTDGVLPNVWLGTSVEDQKRADERIPHLLQTPAAVRFISAEPLLGPLRLDRLGDATFTLNAFTGEARHLLGMRDRTAGKLDWVITGGESGPGARPMHPDWARSLRDQCAAAGVPFFFKQWGEWNTRGAALRAGAIADPYQPVNGDNVVQPWGADDVVMARIGKKAAGRLLDGVEHNGMPEGEAAL